MFHAIVKSNAMPIVWLGQPVPIFPVGCSTAFLFVLSWARLHFGYYKQATKVQKMLHQTILVVGILWNADCGKLSWVYLRKIGCGCFFLQNEGKMRNEST